MAVFNTNQARQFYVVDSQHTVTVNVDDKKSHLYFTYKGAVDSMRSDIVPLGNILGVTVTEASKMYIKPKSYKVTLDTGINSGNPVSGQDYILRIAFRQYVGLSDEDQYFKYGVVHAYAGMSQSKFYITLAVSLYKNFIHEPAQLVKIGLVKKEDSSVVYVDGTNVNTIGKDATEYSGVLITEVEQEWVLGTFSQVPVYFTIQPTNITYNGDELIWGKVDEVPANSADIIGNGKKIADMEYFYMGERGDFYRNVGFPNVIHTKYLVNPDSNYNTIDIHYFYEGSNENVQKSEKTITLAVLKDGKEAAEGNTLTNSIITQLNSKASLGISTI